jgi:outer membrane lipoprotein-sorting protein
MAVRLEFPFVTAVLATLLLATPARADAAGDAAVAAMDAALNRASTLIFDYQIYNQELGKPERILMMKLQAMGPKRLYEFTAPADMAGTKLLVLSPTQMYIYLPAFGKVRRIASHTRDQGFLGLAFSQDDLATTSYGGEYAGQIASQTPTQYLLVLTSRTTPELSYSRIEMTVTKDRMLPLQLKYFNAEGANTKTESRSGYSCEGVVCTPGETKMVDNIKGNSTRLVRMKWQQNVAIPDDVLSVRNLNPP